MMQDAGFGGFSVHSISFPHFRYLFFLNNIMALFPFNQKKKKKKKKKKGQQQTYGCDREVVYASEWFFLFKAI